jgi:hypothetical protein
VLNELISSEEKQARISLNANKINELKLKIRQEQQELAYINDPNVS